MPHAVLKRFDQLLFKDKNPPSDLSQILATGTHVELYRQGATVSSGVTISGGQADVSVSVYDTGDIKAGSVLQVGIGGPRLTVGSVTDATHIKVTNLANFSVTLAAGNRLIVVSDRPSGYGEPLGAGAAMDAFAADTGRALGYLRWGRLDTVATGAVTPDAASSASMSSGTQLTWSHTVKGVNRYLVVAVCWTAISGTGEEYIESVKYGAQSLSFLGETQYFSLWGFVAPNLGTANVEIRFGGASNFSAAAGALSASGVHQSTPLGSVQAASSSSGQPTLNVTGTVTEGLVFAALGLLGSSDPTARVATSPQFDQWNVLASSTVINRCAGSTRPGGGTVTTSWNLSPSVPWNLLAVELKPVSGSAGFTPTLYLDSAGAPTPTPAWLNVESFPSIQAAIDALPPEGGAIYLPARTYDLTVGLVINKRNVTLIGDGHTTVLRGIPGDPAYNIDVITVTQAEFRMYNLKIDGAATGGNLSTGRCGLIINGSTSNVSHCYLENVLITGASRYGIWLKSVIIFTAINSEFVQNAGHGGRVDTLTSGATTTRFIDCQFSSNGGIGLEAANVFGLTCFGSTFEGNLGTVSGVNAAAGRCLDVVTGRVEIYACAFENSQTSAAYDNMVRLSTCPAAVVDGCYFDGDDVIAKQPKVGVFFSNSPWARLSNSTGVNLKDFMARFDGECQEAIELGNYEISTTTPPPTYPPPARIDIQANILEGPRVISMSRRAFGIPNHKFPDTRPNSTEAQPGSLLWVDSPTAGQGNLQIWNGSAWANIPIKSAKFTWGGSLGTILSLHGNSISTGKTSDEITPLSLYMECSGVPINSISLAAVSLYRNSATKLFHVMVGNPSSVDIDMTGVSLVLTYYENK